MSRTPTFKASERGFTLAALIVILTIISIMVAYTVPRQWSMILQRDRERQTIFIMQQYARAILTWQQAHGGYPTSLDQLKDARSPRLVRGPKAEYADPLTGQVDWILIPPGAVQTQPPPTIGGGTINGTGVNPPPTTTGTQTGTANSPNNFNPQASPKDYVGPFVGVRPNKTGKSLLTFRGADQYDQWSYTVIDLNNDMTVRNNPPQFK
jgi:type II secretory pathway pseudopilin PulG